MKIQGRKPIHNARKVAHQQIDRLRDLPRIHARKLWEAQDFMKHGIALNHYFLREEAASTGKSHKEVAQAIIKADDEWARDECYKEARRLKNKNLIRQSEDIDEIRRIGLAAL